MGKPEGRRPFERPRLIWEGNVKMDLREMGWGTDWIDISQDRDMWQTFVNAVMNVRAP